MDASAWDERYAEHELVWSVTPNLFVAERLAGLAPGRAVDLAAGEGRNAIWLAQQGWQVTALDFSAVGLEKGRRLADAQQLAGSVDWKVGDATAPADPLGPVDLVVVAYLQLPAAERRAAVRSAYSALGRGGRLLWIAHDSSNLTEGTGGPQDPAVLMTADDVLADLDAIAGHAAYRVVEAGRVDRPVEVGHGEEPGLTARDCLVHVVREA